MSKQTLALCVASAIGFALAGAAIAQPPPPPAAPPVVSKDPATVPAGVYNLDLNHSAVIARISHSYGVSISTLRFGVTKATLTWDPANVSAIKLDATVDAKPHYDPITYGTKPEGESFLNTDKFPTATFTSTGVTRTGPAKADVAGNLTLLGVTKPVVLHIEMVGASKNRQGAPIVGFTGTLQIKRTDFGNNFLVNNVGNDVNLQLDGEFDKAG